MAEQAASLSCPPPAASNCDLQPDEWSRLKKRRKDVKEYEPPKWTSNHVDVVSGQYIEQSMVEHASILHRRIGTEWAIIFPLVPPPTNSCFRLNFSCGNFLLSIVPNAAVCISPSPIPLTDTLLCELD